jgi:hypothetical protein
VVYLASQETFAKWLTKDMRTKRSSLLPLRICWKSFDGEKDALWTSGPFDLRVRAYMVMNCLITSWQVKDWVYSALKVSGRLEDLNAYAGRKIKDEKEFGAYLTGALPKMKIAYQIATASKHREMYDKNNDPNVRSEVGKVRVEIRGGYERDELFVFDGQEGMSAQVLIDGLYIYWKRVLYDLGLISEEEPFISSGDTPLEPGTTWLRLKKSD